MTTPLLKVSDLSVVYHQTPILKSFELEVKPGEFWGILGPNGSGKTTLLKTIGGWIKPVQGSVEIQGQKLSLLSRKEIALRVAFMLSDELHGSYEVLETVLMGRYPHQDRWESYHPSDHDLVAETLSKVGLYEKRHRSLGQLSQGERQRVLLARALVQETPLLLLDEPTSHLDIKNQGEIFQLLEKLCLDKKIAIISILHSIDLSATFNSHMLMLKNGEILAKGSKQEVLTEKNLTALYEIPIQLIQTNLFQYSVSPSYRR